MNKQRLGMGFMFSILAVGVVLLLVVFSINAGNNSNRPSTTSTPTVTTSAGVAASTVPDPWLQKEQSGELHTMLQQHQAMMQQMQASASPQMLVIMRNDPMWQMLESGELIKEMEQHQADINRMLAQPGQ